VLDVTNVPGTLGLTRQFQGTGVKRGFIAPENINSAAPTEAREGENLTKI
jgi:hypothetical protein